MIYLYYKATVFLSNNQIYKKLQNIDKSLELAIRDDAFDNGNIDPSLKKIFENTGLNIDDYPYHKIVFERWRNERK